MAAINEARVEAIKKISRHIYWRDIHAARLQEAIFEALDAGISQKRVARLVGVSEDTIYRMRKRGKYPTVKWTQD